MEIQTDMNREQKDKYNFFYNEQKDLKKKKRLEQLFHTHTHTTHMLQMVTKDMKRKSSSLVIRKCKFKLKQDTMTHSLRY